jgi:hypothetical protein
MCDEYCPRCYLLEVGSLFDEDFWAADGNYGPCAVKVAGDYVAIVQAAQQAVASGEIKASAALAAERKGRQDIDAAIEPCLGPACQAVCAAQGLGYRVSGSTCRCQ